MTPLEQLIREQVRLSTATTMSRTAEKLGEELAAEILRDPAFRKQMKQLAEAAFADTMAALATPKRPRKPKGKPKGGGA